MEEQQEKSNWDELARQLGAEPRPEPEQPPVLQQAPVRVPDRSIESSFAASVTPPKRPPAGWDVLASEFGLPTPEPDTAPVVNEVSVPQTPGRPVPPEATAEPAESAPPQRRGRRGGSRSRRDDDSSERPRGTAQRESRPRERHDSRSRERNVEESRERREERPREKTSQRREPRRGRSAPRIEAESPRPEETDEPTIQSAASEIEASEPSSVQSTTDVAPEAQPAKPSAISLWHKIFGLPAELASAPEPAAIVPEKTGDDLPSVRESSSLYDTAAEDLAADAASVIDPAAEIDTARDEEEISTSGDSESRRPSRRRRRGRGGRGRRSSSEPGESKNRNHRDRVAAAAAGPDVRDEDQEEQFDELEENAADDDFSESDESALGDDLSDGADVDEFSTSRGKSAVQRSIPSWEETIGYIVETNMQSRTQRRPSGPAGSRSSSRGRPPRGRRRS